MRIAILGATSQIARDLIQSFAKNSSHDLVLYARRPQAVTLWLNQANLAQTFSVADFAALTTDEHFDAILNFVGVGNPARAAAMGASIFDVTLTYDEMALGYVRQHPTCRYIFLSSGAAYGSNFETPADPDTRAVIDINHLRMQDWYGVAKMHAECRHRTLTGLPIVDIRIFNYFSASADIQARFLITDILRAIMHGELFRTSQTNITRDYAGPQEISELVRLVLSAPPVNAVVDSFTREPVDKLSMLEAMRSEFGLRYELVAAPTGMTATGNKTHYYSRNHKAAELFGYAPKATSVEVVIQQARQLLASLDH